MPTRNKADRIAFLSIFSGGMFFLITVTAVVGAYGFTTPFIPMWASEVIARHWGIVCLVYVLSEFVPLLAPFATGEREFSVDRYTWWLLSFGAIGLTILLLSMGVVQSDAWLIMWQTYLTVAIDGLLILLLLKIRAEFRKHP